MYANIYRIHSYPSNIPFVSGSSVKGCDHVAGGLGAWRRGHRSLVFDGSLSWDLETGGLYHLYKPQLLF